MKTERIVGCLVIMIILLSLATGCVGPSNFSKPTQFFIKHTTETDTLIVSGQTKNPAEIYAAKNMGFDLIRVEKVPPENVHLIAPAEKTTTRNNNRTSTHSSSNDNEVRETANENYKSFFPTTEKSSAKQ